MRKTIAIALLNIFLALVCAAQSKPDGEKDVLLGAVQTVTTERGIISTSGKEVARRLESTQRFDDLGNIVESTLYDIGGPVLVASKGKPPVSRRSAFQYNPQAGKKEETTYDSKIDVTFLIL